MGISNRVSHWENNFKNKFGEDVIFPRSDKIRRLREAYEAVEERMNFCKNWRHDMVPMPAIRQNVCWFCIYHEDMPANEDAPIVPGVEDAPHVPVGEDAPHVPANEDDPHVPAVEDAPAVRVGEDSPTPRTW